MARPGRKRNPKAKRHQTTAEGQGRKQKATPERLAHFEAATGRKRANNFDCADATIVHLMFDVSLITQEQFSVALDYQTLFKKRTSAAFRYDNAVSYAKQLVGSGSVSMPVDVLDERHDEDEERYKKLTGRMTKPERDMVHNIVIKENVPQFYIKRRNRDTFNNSDVCDLATFLSGLNSLLGR